MFDFFGWIAQGIAGFLNIPIAIVTALLSLFLTFGGCSYQEGTGGIFDKSEAQKKLSCKYNPWSGTMDWAFFSNDGTGLTASRLYAKSGDKEFEATDVVITDKNVEVRGADANTMEVQWIGATAYTKAHWDGAIGLATQIAGPLSQWMKDNPKDAQKPDIVRGVVEMFAKQAVSAGGQ